MSIRFPPGEKPPPPLAKGPGHQNLQDRFNYYTAMSVLAADPSILIVPGTENTPGRISATGLSADGTPMGAFELYDASDKDGLKIGVTYGTAYPAPTGNNSGPTFASGVNAYPDKFTAGNKYKCVIPVTAKGYCHLHLAADIATANGGPPVVTQNTIQVGSVDNPVGDSDGITAIDGFILLGSWDITPASGQQKAKLKLIDSSPRGNLLFIVAQGIYPWTY